MLRLRLLSAAQHQHLLFSPYTIGLQNQYYMNRLNGFTATQILFCLSGSGILRIGGKGEYNIKKNHIFILSAGLAHEYFPKEKEPWVVGFVSFFERLEGQFEALFQLKSIVMEAHSLERIINLVREMYQLAEPDESEKIWKIGELLLVFIMEVKKQTCATHQILIKPQLHPSEKAYHHAISYMKEHFSQPMLLSDLAHSLGYTPQHLNRIFKQMCGRTPHKHLQMLRLQHAIDLLEKEPDLKIEEVAQRVGLEYNHFIRMFKKRFDKTPGEAKRKT